MKFLPPRMLAYLSVWLNPLILRLPKLLVIKLYSAGRRYFLHSFYHQSSAAIQISFQPRILWGLTFRLPLMNAAGMFKNGEGYTLALNQGAGAYLGGTSTFNPRRGNIKLGITHPFISLPSSGVSMNFLGLPNQGDQRLSKLEFNKIPGCPLGWSLMRSPDYPIKEAQEKLLASLWLYHGNSAIDFLEINESCPNVNHLEPTSDGLDILENRLYYISKNFLDKRKRRIPVILKLSNDLLVSQLPALLDVVLACKFDGINLGNTSTNYTAIRLGDKSEQTVFDYFSKNIGGGIGGRYLNKSSLELCSAAVRYVKEKNPSYEFHVIRCGGISKLNDIIDSEQAGISLNQWYTGYFENYIKYGDRLYARIFNPN